MKRYEIARLGIVLLIILCMNIRFLNMKSGYYVDEGMTLFLANGHYNGTVTSRSEYGIDSFIATYIIKDGDNPLQVIQNVWGMLNELIHAGNYSKEGSVQWYDDARRMLQGKTEWISGEELFQELVAGRGERFQYSQVYVNQALDVHPCFYYALVHTVFSIFPGIYSDAFLFAINMVFLIMTCLVMYRMVKECFKDERAAFFSVVLFGFSQGFASCAVYFRMYAVLTFFVAMTLYLHLKFQKAGEQGRIDKRKMTELGITVLLGFNTHYYYILFLFPLFLLTCVWMRKEKSLCRRYIRCMVLTGVISLIIWPFSVYHILFGYRGTEAVSNVFSDGLLQHLWGYLKELGSALFAGSAWIGAFLLVISVAFCLAVWHKGDENRRFIVGMFVPCAVYFVLIAQIAPTISDRYIMCLLPCMAVFISVAVSILVGGLCKNAARIIIMSVLGIAYALIGLFLMMPNYLYLEQRGKELALSEDKGQYNCVMLGFDHGQGFPAARKLSEFGQVLVAGRQETDGITSSGHIAAGTVVYVYEGLNFVECLGKLEKNMGLDMPYVELDSDIEGFRAFLYE